MRGRENSPDARARVRLTSRGEESIEKKQRTLTEAEEKSSRRGAEIEDDGHEKTRHKPSLRPYAYAAAVLVRGTKKTSSPGVAAAEDAVDSLRASSEVAADGIRDLEAKMRAEVLAKQRSALSGKANAKEWNYTAYQHRSRRIEPALGATRGVDLERATRDRVALAEKKKKMENNARRW